MKLIFVLLFTTLAFGCEKRNCHDIDGQQVCYDERCSNGESLGCNAGGQGQNCRFCGFGEFPPCGGGPSPLPLPSVKNEPQCSGMSPVSMAEFTRYAHNVGNQGFYNVNVDGGGVIIIHHRDDRSPDHSETTNPQGNRSRRVFRYVQQSLCRLIRSCQMAATASISGNEVNSLCLSEAYT
ncbi:hypothetical protein QR680_015057 [Steinernema hermaphroditum]|uniref:Laminin EGF-like domain-containing protein n=1 Tax=Steinernema hermaphroditum TaxID=289476 RepID=A0AA39ID66_9BILA|nr:hypothetical protein QR680_015057 [Steinernema hermaphroditum]